MPDNLHAPRQDGPEPQQAHTPLRVLIAEDHDTIRKGLLLAFRRAGYHCEEAADGREAREMIASSPRSFHLLVTDHEMPHVSGLELVRDLRHKSPDTRVIVFSGSLTDKLSKGYRDLGVHHIIPKPASFLDLLQVASALRTQAQGS
jgi:two-component system response regulator PilR (NtrC family)